MGGPRLLNFIANSLVDTKNWVFFIVLKSLNLLDAPLDNVEDDGSFWDFFFTAADLMLFSMSFIERYRTQYAMYSINESDTGPSTAVPSQDPPMLILLVLVQQFCSTHSFL